MTRDETKKILMIIQSSFPNWKPVDLSFTIDTWAMMLSDYTYQEISLALKAFVATDTSGFAPSIGQLIEKARYVANGNELSEMEAWELVGKALRNGYYGAEQEFEKLPEIVQKVVGSPSQLRNWSQTDQSSIETVVQSNFMRTYRSEVGREREKIKLPKDVLAIMSNNEANQRELLTN